MNKAWLLLGGNIGDRVFNLKEAKKNLEIRVGKIIRLSKIYETASWGIKEQPNFLNQVLIIETVLSAEQLLNKLLSIENTLGRIRTQKNFSRTIDIDILFFNEEVIEQPELSIPHPQIQNRKFVLIPLNEISPGLVHPVLKKTIRDLLLICTDNLEVKVF